MDEVKRQSPLHTLNHGVDGESTAVAAGTVRACAFCMDGSKLYTASNKTIYSWDRSTGKLAEKYQYHSKAVYALDVCERHGDTLIATGGPDGEVRVWSCERGKVVRRLSAHTGSVFSCRFSGDCSLLASCSADGSALLWDMGGLNQSDASLLDTFPLQSFRGHSGYVFQCDFSSSGALLCTVAADGKAVVWSVRNAKKLKELTGHNKGALCCDWSSVSEEKLVTGDEQGVVRLWNAKSGDLILTFLGHQGYPVSDLQFLRDGRSVASACKRGKVFVWNAGSGRVELSLEGHREGVLSLVVSRAGDAIASGGNDHSRIWSFSEAQGERTQLDIELCRAIDEGNLKLVRSVLEKGANPNCVGPQPLREKPLHMAARKNDHRIVTLLLQFGSVINCEDEAGSTPLHVAAEAGLKGTACVLAKAGANLNAIRWLDGCTPLLLSLEFHLYDIAEELVSMGADVDLLPSAQNVQNDEGEDDQQSQSPVDGPCHWFARNMDQKNKELAELVFSKAKLSSTNTEGDTPLEVAMIAQNEMSMESLRGRGLSLDSVADHHDREKLVQLLHSQETVIAKLRKNLEQAETKEKNLERMKNDLEDELADKTMREANLPSPSPIRENAVEPCPNCQSPFLSKSFGEDLKSFNSLPLMSPSPERSLEYRRLGSSLNTSLYPLMASEGGMDKAEQAYHQRLGQLEDDIRKTEKDREDLDPLLCRVDAMLAAMEFAMEEGGQSEDGTAPGTAPSTTSAIATALVEAAVEFEAPGTTYYASALSLIASKRTVESVCCHWRRGGLGRGFRTWLGLVKSERSREARKTDESRLYMLTLFTRLDTQLSFRKWRRFVLATHQVSVSLNRLRNLVRRWITKHVREAMSQWFAWMDSNPPSEEVESSRQENMRRMILRWQHRRGVGGAFLTWKVRCAHFTDRLKERKWERSQRFQKANHGKLMRTLHHLMNGLLSTGFRTWKWKTHSPSVLVLASVHASAQQF